MLREYYTNVFRCCFVIAFISILLSYFFFRDYNRCTDGIVFVVDSVDTERIEEAKMELMRTAKCPENIGEFTV